MILASLSRIADGHAESWRGWPGIAPGTPAALYGERLKGLRKAEGFTGIGKRIKPVRERTTLGNRIHSIPVFFAQLL